MANKCQFSEFTYAFCFLKSLSTSGVIYNGIQVNDSFLPIIPNLRQEAAFPFDVFLANSEQSFRHFDAGHSMYDAVEGALTHYGINDEQIQPIALQFKIPQKIQYKPHSKPYKRYLQIEACDDEIHDLPEPIPPGNTAFSCEISYEQNKKILEVANRLGISAYYAAPKFVKYVTLNHFYLESNVHNQSVWIIPEPLVQTKNDSHNLYYYLESQQSSDNLSPQFFSEPITALSIKPSELSDHAIRLDKKHFIKNLLSLHSEKMLLDCSIAFLK